MGIGSEKNKPLDVMSITHFGFSFLIGYYKLVNFRLFIVLAIMFEIGEYLFAKTEFSYKFEKVYPLPRHLWDEKFQNKINDKILNIIGYVIGIKLSKKTSYILDC
jgi:hypothetical protein